MRYPYFADVSTMVSSVALRQLLLTTHLFWSVSPARAQHSSFDILKDEDIVGSIAASRILSGDRTLYAMTSYAILNVLWKRVVTTALLTEYTADALHACRTSVRVNGAVRDSSLMLPNATGHQCFVHPGRNFQHAEDVRWTTARMYFEEPAGEHRIFVESVLAHCPLRRAAPGEYHLTFPDGAVNRYLYRDGTLREIHVDRTFMDLVFRRRDP